MLNKAMELVLYNKLSVFICSDETAFIVGQTKRRKVGIEEIQEFSSCVEEVKMYKKIYLSKNLLCIINAFSAIKGIKFSYINSVPDGTLENNPVILNSEYAYKGEVNNFITIKDLRDLTGIKKGKYFSDVKGDDTQIPFLKFQRNDKTTLFVAQKGVKNSISWEDINGGSQKQDIHDASSAVYGAMKKNINGNTYKIRLLSKYSTTTMPTKDSGQGEWYNLIFGLHNHNPHMYDVENDTKLVWLQEEYKGEQYVRTCGSLYPCSVSYEGRLVDQKSFHFSWRPVFELISK